jgi:hypothetical protein
VAPKVPKRRCASRIIIVFDGEVIVVREVARKQNGVSVSAEDDDGDE